MKTKKLFLCLLFLVLGTTAWADKYYKVGGRVTGALEYGTGKKYMIFNTAFDGTQDRTGFLYNMGTTFGLKKFTSVDKFVCNEAFVFELENAGDEDQHTFYLKSVPSGGYMDLNGCQSATPTVLKLYTWDEAKAGDEYTVETGGVTLEEKNGIKQACVKSLNAGNTVITENNVTSESDAVYVIANEDDSWYFNGNTDSYATWQNGHPYAFYECQEMTSAETFNLQDLHIYSRADYYSAQLMYGFVKSASQITSSPATGGEGDAANLIDGNFKTGFLTNPNDNSQVHYYQIDLKESVSSLRFYMACRSDKKYAPLTYEVLATNDPNGGWVKVSEGNTTLNTYLAYVSPIINLGASYRYIRIQAPNGRSSAEQCLALSELYVLPDREEINIAMACFDNTLPVAAPEGTYKALIDQYNAKPAGTAAKLFSGVPFPGNKYRIYADAYSGGVYVNRHIAIKETEGNYGLNALGDYYTAGDEQEAYEWYCEESTDGKLLFRNVKYPTLFLANCTVDDNANLSGWEIETNGTQHHGVPLKNGKMQYLALYNDGVNWMGDVKKVQDQTVTTGTLDFQNTPDNDTDDVAANGGLCTDFVFIPVELDNDEVQFTITASELANRNSKLTVGGTVYELPFSKVFYNGVPEITIESTAGDFHEFIGFYKNGTLIGNTIDNALFTNSTLKGGDIVEARFQVNANKLPTVSTAGNIVLYQIKNRRPKSAQQNAGMSRVGLGYEDEEFNSMETGGNYYYASFNSKNMPLDMYYNANELMANSFFYFTNAEAEVGENFMVSINSAITTFRCNKPNEWTPGGSLYYIQPNAVGGGHYGFAITRTPLDASNNPEEGWNAKYTNAGNTVVGYNVEDANSAWEFVPVKTSVATEKLTLYIKETAADMIDSLKSKLGDAEFDSVKIKSTIGVIEEIAGKYTDGSFSGGNITGADVTALVGYAQELHMLHHEVEYAMRKLPEPTDESDKSFQPKWYYIKNVNTGHYARYQGADKLMTLTSEIGNNKLPHLFYFAGKTVNEGTKDEYLAAHIHNFMALNLKDASKDSTLVSYNRELLTTDVVPNGNGSQTKIYLEPGQQLKNSEAWRLELDFNLASGAFFNGWGSGLLAAGGNGTATQDGGTYYDGFQVYLQNSGKVVIRGGNNVPYGANPNDSIYGSGSHDVYVFEHTVGKYSKLKVVVSYANKRMQVAVTNSEGITETIKDTPKGRYVNMDYIPCDNMLTVNEMASAMAGASSFKLKAEVVLAMKWDTHSNNVINGVEGDVWYILPSSNTNYPGLAIVTDSADCTNMGWSNVNGENIEIFTGPGVDDYSTWQLEKVEAYENHIQELLALYDISGCRIYNKELVALYKAIQEIVNSGRDDEVIFNELFNLIRNYDGPSPAELRAPKPGSFYTIRPEADENTKNALQVYVDRQNTYYETTELYNATAIDNANDVDSRAVWIFEGNNIDADGFYTPEGLKVKNIHTQTYLSTLGADASKLTNSAATVDLIAGACTAGFKLGDTYMSMVGDNRIDYTKNKYFWGFALDEYPTQIGGVVSGNNLNAGKVHGNSMDIVVETEGNVTVTFTHEGGSHKLNVLGVQLTNASGDVVNEVYEHGTAGDNPKSKSYDLGTVAPGTYTLHSYVWNYESGDKVDMAQGYITVAGAAGVKGLTNTGTENTKWIIEEIMEPEDDICYTTTIEDGYSTIMLAFDAIIPNGVEAYYGAIDGIVVDKKYLSMEKYESSILPAYTPVVLKSAVEGQTIEDAKFYYSKVGGTREPDDYMRGSITYTVVSTDVIENELGAEVNIYMLQREKTGPRMYWIYEEYNGKGELSNPNSDSGKHVICKANKAYIVIGSGEAAGQGSFMFSFKPNGVTDIDEVNAEDGYVDAIYDLQGRRLDEITHPGVYIVNGRKVVVK